MPSESAESLRKLYDGTTEAVKALESLARPVKEWDDWLVFVTAQKLDPVTMKDWENSLVSTTILPTFEELCMFLQHRLNTLEAVNMNATRSKEISKNRSQQSSGKFVPLKVHLATNQTSRRVSKCPKCKGTHLLLFCPSFRQQTVLQRRDFFSQGRLCFNCMRPGHSITNCPSPHRYKHYNQLHHTMLHVSSDNNATSSQSSVSSPRAAKPGNTIESITHHQSSDPSSPSSLSTSSSTAICNVTALAANPRITRWPRTILLATAQVILVSPTGRTLQIRALIDQGSQATFVSSFVARYLGLPSRKVNIPVRGVGSSSGVVKSIVSVAIRSTTDQTFSVETSALVLPKLTKISTPQFLIPKIFLTFRICIWRIRHSLKMLLLI